MSVAAATLTVDRCGEQTRTATATAAAARRGLAITHRTVQWATISAGTRPQAAGLDSMTPAGTLATLDTTDRKACPHSCRTDLITTHPTRGKPGPS